MTVNLIHNGIITCRTKRFVLPSIAVILDRIKLLKCGWRQTITTVLIFKTLKINLFNLTFS